AQARQHVQLLPGGHAAHLLGTLAHHLVDNDQLFPIPVAHGDGPPEEQPLQLDIDELARGGDGSGIPQKGHLPHVRRQGPVMSDGISPLLHASSSCHTISPPTMVSRQRPESRHPAKGVARPMVANSEGSTVYSFSRSNAVRSALWPSARGVPRPKRRAGASCSSSKSRSREMSADVPRWGEPAAHEAPRPA